MFYGDYEFRGYELRESSKGNKYCNLFCEDCENGMAVRFYVGSSVLNNYSDIPSLKKGTVIKIKGSYHQGYGGNYQLDFVGYEVVK